MANNPWLQRYRLKIILLRNGNQNQKLKSKQRPQCSYVFIVTRMIRRPRPFSCIVYTFPSSFILKKRRNQMSLNHVLERYLLKLEDKVKQIQAEVDGQVNKKVQQNLASVLKKLGEANPNITINIEELCVTPTSDDDGTPITGGSSYC
ncbi:hypothetical protein POM88_028437 [Heracleum sosnowskyi]|uniref:Uncharacterized protein n=1 Tax=Heracleum sosnowskyi TaxID=360622 RepID=A0AAD8MGR4_9APIA|nr:hypothetical protein POM88_028437 [Heracleum sosnowskyi]